MGLRDKGKKLTKCYFFFRIQKRTNCGKAQNYMGGTPHRNNYTGRGGHHTYFLDWGNNWGGKNYIIVGGDTAQH